MKSDFNNLGSSVDRCGKCPARSAGVCNVLSERDRIALAEQSSYSVVFAGTCILGQEAVCDRVGIVVSGTAKVVYSNTEGHQHILQLLYPGHLVGDPLGARSLVSWEAATDLVLCWIPAEKLEELTASHPGLYPGFLKAVQKQRELVQLWNAKLRGRSTRERLAYWLITQAYRERSEFRPAVKITLTRRDLASYLNMSSEALCRALQQLHEGKAIAKVAPDQVIIRDLDKLRVFASCVEDQAMRTLSRSLRATELTDEVPLVS